MKIKNTTVNIDNSEQPPNKEALKAVYDVCNKIFNNNNDLFYDSDEVVALKKDKNNIFI